MRQMARLQAYHYRPGAEGYIFTVSDGQDGKFIMQISAFSNQLTQALVKLSKPLLYKLLEMQTVANDFDVSKMDRVVAGVPDHFVTLDTDGNVKDSGKAVTAGDVVGTSDSQALSNKTLISPVIGSFTNANHDHSSAITGGNVSLSGIICHDDQVVCYNNEVVTL